MIALLILILLAGAFGVVLSNNQLARIFALGTSLIAFVIAMVMLMQFEPGPAKQFITDLPWIPSLGIRFHLAADGISLLLVLLTTTLTPLIIFSAFNKTIQRPPVFYALVLFMEMALIGVFTAMDGLLFYVFWELALIPIYFICLLWGGEGRRRITFKFFLYTMMGSLFMLAALIALYLHTPFGTFDITALYEAGHSMDPVVQRAVFWGLFLGFAVKIPVFPFHTWQPDTYTNAPAQGSMLLSAIMLKMGVYGILRWLVPAVPLGLSAYGGLTITLAIIGLVYASCIALVQTDFKRLIAYSSLAHVGLMAAGALSMQTYAWHGVMVQMLSHGVLVFGLFYAAELLMRRMSSTSMLQMGGIRNLAPVFAVALLVIVLGNVALPLTSGFPGEFLLLAGLFHYNKALAIVGGLTVILGAVYMLKAYQKTCLGEVAIAGVQFRDVDLNEKIVLGIVAALILVIGVCPSPIIEIAGPALDTLLQTSGAQGVN